MQEKKVEQQTDLTLADADSSKAKYRKPQFIEAGTVEELTHGSRTKESDEPDSGHHGD